jgi:hypothetical protein
MARLNPNSIDLGPEDLVEALERYATLRDTIQGLEVERDALATQLKEALTADPTLRLQTDLYRADVRKSMATTYPLERFREVFGDAATLEVSVVDKKKADARVKAGELDGAALNALAVTKERAISLVLTAVDR